MEVDSLSVKFYLCLEKEVELYCKKIKPKLSLNEVLSGHVVQDFS